MKAALHNLVRRVRGESGFTLLELLASMTILMSIMGGLTSLLVSGTKAQVDLSNRFQAQTEARLGLDWIRRDVHKATCATTATSPPSITLTVGTCGAGTDTTWCVEPKSGTSWHELWRYAASSCTGTGRKVADYLTTAAAFAYTAPAGSTAAGTGQLAFATVTLDVNLTPGRPERVYSLDDNIVLRNSSRPA